LSLPPPTIVLTITGYYYYRRDAVLLCCLSFMVFSCNINRVPAGNMNEILNLSSYSKQYLTLFESKRGVKIPLHFEFVMNKVQVITNHIYCVMMRVRCVRVTVMPIFLGGQSS
jgi:hypothetical protein